MRREKRGSIILGLLSQFTCKRGFGITSQTRKSTQLPRVVFVAYCIL